MSAELTREEIENIRASRYGVPGGQREALCVMALRTADLERELAQAREALTQSVSLQSHYAYLLNMHDGGTRMVFDSAETWLRRLGYVDDVARKAAGGEPKP